MGTSASVWWLFYIVILHYTLRGNCTCFEVQKVIQYTKSGNIVGSVHEVLNSSNYKIKEFLAVPYAEPPVGSLRFVKPRKPQKWDTYLVAYCLPNSCVQSTSNPWPWPWKLNHTDMSEDCLYLNIWVPYEGSTAGALNKRAVLFFIHGGGIVNASGSASDFIYNGRVLSVLGDIIVVVPNYRIGTLGFWSTRSISYYPLVSSEGKAPGNLGIWDIIQALMWTQENIFYFGGDPGKITVAGQGFGAVIASLLPLTYEANGLFRRLILQSGSAMWQHNKHITYNHDISMDIARKLDCVNNTTDVIKDELKIITCMHTKNATDLAEAEVGTDGFLPVWGDDLFKDDPRIEILKRKFRLDDLFVGFSGNEEIPFFLDSNPGEDVFKSIQKSEVMLSDQQSETILPRLLTKRNSPAKNESLSNGYYTIICPLLYYAQRCESYKVNVFFYHFNYRTNNSIYADWINATHFDEMQFVFGLPYIDKELYTPFEKSISSKILAAWSTFAKDGMPTVFSRHFDDCGVNKIVTFENGVFPRPVEIPMENLFQICDDYRGKY